ncbi:MAG: alanine racemase [Firmicutes bacterium]|nr:alanine racemase [Bacillota bacterium]
MIGLSQIRPAWAEVDLDAIANNISVMKAGLAPGSSIMAVVKAAGYGHGAVPVARASLDAGAGSLGVATLHEALELRRAGITAPVLVLGYTPEEQAEIVVANDVTQAVWTIPGVQALLSAARRLGKPALMHLKIDSGMGRIGARPGEELDRLVEALMSAGLEEIDGAFTHFSVADTDPDYTEHQFATFMDSVEKIERRGLRARTLHCCGSAALIGYREYHLDMIRPGIVLYGYPPVPAQGFRIALTIKARLSHVKTVNTGDSISYGRTYIADRAVRVGSLPLGYADGYRRVLSNKGEVVVGGTRARILGRVCMDQFMVDLSGIEGVSAGDVVTVLSSDPKAGPTAADLAAACGTIVNDILTGLSPRLPRVYHRGGEWFTLDPGGARLDVDPGS